MYRAYLIECQPGSQLLWIAELRTEICSPRKHRKNNSCQAESNSAFLPADPKKPSKQADKVEGKAKSLEN